MFQVCFKSATEVVTNLSHPCALWVAHSWGGGRGVGETWDTASVSLEHPAVRSRAAWIFLLFKNRLAGNLYSSCHK